MPMTKQGDLTRQMCGKRNHTEASCTATKLLWGNTEKREVALRPRGMNLDSRSDREEGQL